MSGMKMLLDGSRGIYVPSTFVELYNVFEWGFYEDEHNIATLAEGPDGDSCWDAWDEVLNKAEFIDQDGNKWFLHHDEDLWAMCEALMTEEEHESFFGEPNPLISLGNLF
jgi:hypothetical protein